MQWNWNHFSSWDSRPCMALLNCNELLKQPHDVPPAFLCAVYFVRLQLYYQLVNLDKSLILSTNLSKWNLLDYRWTPSTGSLMPKLESRSCPDFSKVTALSYHGVRRLDSGCISELRLLICWTVLNPELDSNLLEIALSEKKNRITCHVTCKCDLC